MELRDLYARAAAELRRAGALVVTAGAGMGVDSGLPDFRGDQGFWKAYPPYERLGLSFIDAANPAHFDDDPPFGWGFYGHRTNLYRSTTPHAGFAILLAWVARFRLPFFVVTSNVDGQFQKAGFPEDRVLEVHGSIHHLQCTTPLLARDLGERRVARGRPATMRSRQVPRCPELRRGLAPEHPHVRRLLVARRADRRAARAVRGVPPGGRRAPAPRRRARGRDRDPDDPLDLRAARPRRRRVVMRVNPREPDIAPPHLSIRAGALEALAGHRRALAVPRGEARCATLRTSPQGPPEPRAPVRCYRPGR